MARSPWIGVDPGVDPGVDAVGWARLLSRAHLLAVQEEVTQPLLRPVVASSWKRAAESGVDPDAPASAILNDRETGQALARHRLSSLLPVLRTLVADAAGDGRHIGSLSIRIGLGWAKSQSFTTGPSAR